MKVRNLIVWLQQCDPDAYVTDGECHGICRVIESELIAGEFGSDIGGDEEVVSTPIVMLHAGLSAGVDG